MSKEKMFFSVCENYNNCTCSCRESKKDIGSIDLQMTYDAYVISAVCKTNTCLAHNYCKTEVRCLRASHVANDNSSLNRFCT